MTSRLINIIHFYTVFYSGYEINIKNSDYEGLDVQGLSILEENLLIQLTRIKEMIIQAIKFSSSKNPYLDELQLTFITERCKLAVLRVLLKEREASMSEIDV